MSLLDLLCRIRCAILLSFPYSALLSGLVVISHFTVCIMVWLHHHLKISSINADLPFHLHVELPTLFYLDLDSPRLFAVASQ